MSHNRDEIHDICFCFFHVISFVLLNGYTHTFNGRIMLAKHHLNIGERWLIRYNGDMCVTHDVHVYGWTYWKTKYG